MYCTGRNQALPCCCSPCSGSAMSASQRLDRVQSGQVQGAAAAAAAVKRPAARRWLLSCCALNGVSWLRCVRDGVGHGLAGRINMVADV
jgi:hypothetical protein